MSYDLSLVDYYKSNYLSKKRKTNSRDSILKLKSNKNSYDYDFMSFFNMQLLFQFYRNNQYRRYSTYNEYAAPANAVKKARGELGHRGGERYGEPGRWCAAFVSWAYGGKNSPWGDKHRVADIKKWAQKENIYQEGSNPANVKPGDLVIWRPETCNGISHVEIVTDVVNGKIKTVGGNCYNKVMKNEYQEGARFDGFVRVSKYNNKKNNSFTAYS